MLSRSEFFKGSSEMFLQELSPMLEVELFLPGQDIIQQGQEGDKMYFLNWGAVQVVLGDQVVGDIGCGSVFGEMALFGNGKRSCTVRATATCDCRSVDQHRFQRLLNCYPEERERFERLVEGRLQETSRLKQDIRKLREPEERQEGRLRWRSEADFITIVSVIIYYVLLLLITTIFFDLRESSWLETAQEPLRHCQNGLVACCYSVKSIKIQKNPGLKHVSGSGTASDVRR